MTGSAYPYKIKHFEQLTPAELYAILRLRNEVFVVEQNCVFQDADNKDIYCHHLMLYDHHQLIAYARLVPQGVSYREMSVGRVVTAKEARNKGVAKQLMKLAVQNCRKLFGEGPIRIGAQYYLENFYSSIGFARTGDIYDEDGIEHIEMIMYK
ncbi:MAG TPA: GNAT family N-acetyltransferase [Flavitalea sp.]|nr:GNAT family N-acetyltransferase [Flavitalea sp.]